MPLFAGARPSTRPGTGVFSHAARKTRTSEPARDRSLLGFDQQLREGSFIVGAETEMARLEVQNVELTEQLETRLVED